jgi:hypothetical protein
MPRQQAKTLGRVDSRTDVRREEARGEAPLRVAQVLVVVAGPECRRSPPSAVAACAWCWTLVPLVYLAGSPVPTPESAAEKEKYRDLDRRYSSRSATLRER